MVRVRDAPKEHPEPLGDALGANGGIGSAPVSGALRAERRAHQIHRSIEVFQDLVFRPARRVGELLRPVADVARPCDLGSDVVVEIAGQVQQEMPDRVAVWKRPPPELLFDRGSTSAWILLLTRS